MIILILTLFSFQVKQLGMFSTISILSKKYNSYPFNIQSNKWNLPLKLRIQLEPELN